MPSEEGSGNVPAEEPRRSRVKSARRCANRNIDYAEEKCDSFFANTSGYTNFGRTRKGGDRRPNAAGTQDSSRFSEIPTNDKTFVFFFCVCAGKVKTIPAPKAQRVTLLNFFARGTMQPIPIQSSQSKKKKHPPPKTRVAKYGRPLKQGNTALSRAEKVARMHQSVKRKFADGVLLSTPTKRREWSGAVRLLVEVFSCCSLLTYVILVQMRIKVDRCTDVLLQESGGSPEMMS